VEAGTSKGASRLLEVSASHSGDSLRVVTCVFLFQSRETREILHFHYTTWPDFGVPESPASFLNFLFKVRESGSLSREHGPIVVHCSAGIGRSGTFCLADTCLLLVRRPSRPQEAEGACSDLQADLAAALCHCLQSASFGLDFLAASLPSRELYPKQLHLEQCF
jgi:protein tyrosine phosphatase